VGSQELRDLCCYTDMTAVTTRCDGSVSLIGRWKTQISIGKSKDKLRYILTDTRKSQHNNKEVLEFLCFK
jgi:hypothetical protein